MQKEIVKNTFSGLITRYETDFGLLVFSPFNGLIFAVSPDDAGEVSQWLNKKNSLIKDPYNEVLGLGWKIDSSLAVYKKPHLLPDSKSFPIVLSTRYPILINWLITGKCKLACKYCYAEDLMRNNSNEPNKDDLEKIVESILNYKPIAVVIAGGEPLLSPFFVKAIELLNKKTGIIVDTSASEISDEHLTLFKKYNINIRISLDSEIPELNQKQRPYYLKSKNKYTLSSAIELLCRCIKENIPVTVQSVATSKTANDLPFLGDKLYKLGLHSWRVLKIQPSRSSMKGYNELVGSKIQQNRLYNHIFKELNKFHNLKWKSQMALQIIQNENPNAVILVSPNGTFYTESNVSPGKVIIDEEKPKNPRLKMIQMKVNMKAHAERYLNLR